MSPHNVSDDKRVPATGDGDRVRPPGEPADPPSPFWDYVRELQEEFEEQEEEGKL